MSDPSPFTFRNSVWGMSPDQVLASEPTPPVVQTDGQVGYLTEILERKLYLAYCFKQGKLVSAFYALREVRPDLAETFRDFKDFKEVVTLKYGEPNAGHGDAWTEAEYKSGGDPQAVAQNPAQYAEALLEGRLVHAALWRTDRSWIKVALGKMMDGHSCGITVEYYSNELT